MSIFFLLFTLFAFFSLVIHVRLFRFGFGLKYFFHATKTKLDTCKEKNYWSPRTNFQHVIKLHIFILAKMNIQHIHLALGHLHLQNFLTRKMKNLDTKNESVYTIVLLISQHPTKIARLFLDFSTNQTLDFFTMTYQTFSLIA